MLDELTQRSIKSAFQPDSQRETYTQDRNIILVVKTLLTWDEIMDGYIEYISYQT